MKLIKIKDGLLEAENFFLASSFIDFATEANVSRDIASGEIRLISNNRIERNFNYNEFVIEIEKENFKHLEEDSFSMIYLSSDSCQFGIKDSLDYVQNKYWKILKETDYIQAYSSQDGLNYTNVGGMRLTEPILKQGFRKNSKEDFILNSYKVYSNPYITIQNFPEGTIVELYNSEDILIKVREFGPDMECKIFLDTNIKGYFIFKDIQGSILYTTKNENLDFKYGDVYIMSPYNFEVIYRGVVVTNQALLTDLEELITIRNIGDVSYKNISIGTQTSGDDLIQLSLDGINYRDKVVLDVGVLETKDIYVRITKNISNHNFTVRNFELIINE